jgi:hypothetical protein
LDQRNIIEREVAEEPFYSLQGMTQEELQEINPSQDNHKSKLGITFGGGGVR